MAYITVDDLRAEGVTDPPYCNKHLESRITLACSQVELCCGQFFEPRANHELVIDGRGHDTLFLPYPPTTESSITKIEHASRSQGGTTWIEVDVTDWETVMSQFPDGRWNPKVVKLVGDWLKGTRNYRLTGTFGFVESDGETTPPGIKELTTRIAIWNMPTIGDVSAQQAYRIVEEELDKYRVKLSDATKGGGMFNDSNIDRLITMFKPRRMRSV